MKSILIILALAVVLGGCGTTSFLSQEEGKTSGVLNLGDGKILGIDLMGSVKQVFDILPSCNKDKLLTASCIIGCVDGISGSQSTIDPADKATQDAIKQLGLSLTGGEEYQCCKAMGIAGSYLVNKYGGNASGLASLVKFLK